MKLISIYVAPATSGESLRDSQILSKLETK